MGGEGGVVVEVFGEFDVEEAFEVGYGAEAVK